MGTAYEVTHVSRIPSPYARGTGEGEWKSIRHHFDIKAFGASAYVGHEEGDWVVPEHDEASSNTATKTPHEELYFVANGEAAFTVGGDTFAAPSGTFVFVRDPTLVRKAIAQERGTTVLAFGGAPGEAFAVSPWEEKRRTSAAVER